MLQQAVLLTIALAVLGAAFFVVERVWPAVPDQPRKRTGRLTDVSYYFFNATVTKFVSTIVIAVIVLLGARAIGQSLSADDLRGLTGRDTVISGLPTAVQFGLLLVIADFIGYWSHRLFHFDPRLWRIHAIHHSSRQLDWLGAVRVHPLNDIITNAVQAIPLLLIGFDFAAFGGYVALITVFAIFLRSNVPWSFGRFRHVVASPVYHRWHHTTEKEGIDKNFAGLLPLWDLAFGTFYMPEGRQPMKFGVLGEPVPDGFWRQLLYPLRPGAVLVSGSK
jgi:sterol desaturase/sphingolipid hydroxylase (fatty acid hydroxylase superfamily)